MPFVTCEEIEPIRGAYVDGALAADEARAVSEHASRCPRCSATIAELRAVDDLIRGTGVPLPSETEWRSLVAAARRPFLRLSPGRFAAAIFIAAAIPIGLSYGLPAPPRDARLDVLTPGLDLDP